MDGVRVMNDVQLTSLSVNEYISSRDPAVSEKEASLKPYVHNQSQTFDSPLSNDAQVVHQEQEMAELHRTQEEVTRVNVITTISASNGCKEQKQTLGESDQCSIGMTTKEFVKDEDASRVNAPFADNGQIQNSEPASQVTRRKRKRSKRLGFSNNRTRPSLARQKKQSLSQPLLTIDSSTHQANDNETNEEEPPQSPLFHEPTLLYSSTPPENTWKWEECAEYFDPLSQEHLLDLVNVRKSCANIVADNPDACRAIRHAQTEVAYLNAMLADASNRMSAHVQPMRRGRHYRDVWEEEDFLNQERKREELSMGKKRGFGNQSLLLLNSELVHGYDDDCFRNYIDRLEGRVENLRKQLAPTAGTSNETTDDDTESIDPARRLKQILHIDQTILPIPPSTQCHPASWGMWKAQNFSDPQQSEFEIIHPASVNRGSISTRWKEEYDYSQHQRKTGNSADNDEEEFKVNGDKHIDGDIAKDEHTVDQPMKLPSFGSDIEEDEISHVLKASLAKLIPLSMYNWRMIQSVYERAACYAQCLPILRAEAATTSRIEELYRQIYPPSRTNDEPESSTPANPSVKLGSTPHDIIIHSAGGCIANESSAAVIASVEYALTLRLGDEVDILDRNGCWCDGVVIDLFTEGGKVLKYILIRSSMWADDAVEWISTTEGRILPRGVAEGRISLTLAPNHTRKQRLELNRALADDLERTFPHRQQIASLRAREHAKNGYQHSSIRHQQKRRKRTGRASINSNYNSASKQ